jgi:hypothetical protein
MEKLFLGVNELMGTAQELSSIMPAVLGRCVNHHSTIDWVMRTPARLMMRVLWGVCGRLLNRESMPDFFAATTRSMAPEGTDGNEAGCIVEVRVRPRLLILCFNRWGMSFAQRPIRILGSVVKASCSFLVLMPCRCTHRHATAPGSSCAAW